MAEFLCGDCLVQMKQIPDESVNLIITSPPYANQLKNYGASVKTPAPGDFIEWFLPRAAEMHRVLAPDGSFVLNISDKVVGKFQDIYVFKLVVALCEQTGFHLVRDYIWYNPATPPNIFSSGTKGRTKKSHEHCFWFSKGDTWTFNMDPIRKPYSSGMRKLLDGKGKGSRSKNTRPSRHNFKQDQKWTDHGGSDPGSVLTISNTASNDQFHQLCRFKGKTHPARYPQKLVEFFMLAGSNKGDVVLDPFAGSGTTAVVAQRLRRDWICIEINSDFCDLARDWIDLSAEKNITA